MVYTRSLSAALELALKVHGCGKSNILSGKHQVLRYEIKIERAGNIQFIAESNTCHIHSRALGSFFCSERVAGGYAIQSVEITCPDNLANCTFSSMFLEDLQHRLKPSGHGCCYSLRGLKARLSRKNLFFSCPERFFCRVRETLTSA